MSSNKQSSVEWAIYQLGKIDMLLRFGEIGVQKYNRLHEEITAKAKAMHKEEIEKTYIKGYEDKDFSYFDPEQYYNETFGGNNENN